jgi:hypothetical protein
VRKHECRVRDAVRDVVLEHERKSYMHPC